MEEPLCCDCAPGKCPFIKIKDRTQPRKAHEDPLMSDLPSLLRPVAALSLCALAPLTTTHRQCLEKLGKGDRGTRCSLRPLAPPLCHIACTNGHAQAQRPNAQAPAAAAAAALWPTIKSICPSNPNTNRRRHRRRCGCGVGVDDEVKRTSPVLYSRLSTFNKYIYTNVQLIC